MMRTKSSWDWYSRVHILPLQQVPRVQVVMICLGLFCSEERGVLDSAVLGRSERPGAGRASDDDAEEGGVLKGAVRDEELY